MDADDEFISLIESEFLKLQATVLGMKEISLKDHSLGNNKYSKSFSNVDSISKKIEEILYIMNQKKFSTYDTFRSLVGLYFSIWNNISIMYSKQEIDSLFFIGLKSQCKLCLEYVEYLKNKNTCQHATHGITESPPLPFLLSKDSNALKNMYLKIFHGYISYLFSSKLIGIGPFSRSQGFIWDRIPELLGVAEYLKFLLKDDKEVELIGKIVVQLQTYISTVKEISFETVIGSIYSRDFSKIRDELLSKFKPNDEQSVICKNFTLVSWCTLALRHMVQKMKELLDGTQNFYETFESIGGKEFLFAFTGIKSMLKILLQFVKTECSEYELDKIKEFQLYYFDVDSLMTDITNKVSTESLKFKISSMEFIIFIIPPKFSREISDFYFPLYEGGGEFTQNALLMCIDILETPLLINKPPEITDGCLLSTINKTHMNQRCNFVFSGGGIHGLNFISMALYNISNIDIYVRLYFEDNKKGIHVLMCRCENIVSQTYSGGGKMCVSQSSDLLDLIQKECPDFRILGFYYTKPCVYVKLHSKFCNMFDNSHFELSIVNLSVIDQDHALMLRIRNEMGNLNHVNFFLGRISGMKKRRVRDVDINENFKRFELLLSYAFFELRNLIRSMKNQDLFNVIDNKIKEIESKISNNKVPESLHEDTRQVMQDLITTINNECITHFNYLRSSLKTDNFYIGSSVLKHILFRLDTVLLYK